VKYCKAAFHGLLIGSQNKKFTLTSIVNQTISQPNNHFFFCRPSYRQMFLKVKEKGITSSQKSLIFTLLYNSLHLIFYKIYLVKLFLIFFTCQIYAKSGLVNNMVQYELLRALARGRMEKNK